MAARGETSHPYLLEQTELGEQIFEVVKAHLKANGMAMKQGTIVDATITPAAEPRHRLPKRGNQAD